MMRKVAMLTAAVLAAAAGPAEAAGLNPMPFAEQVKEADLVVVAKPAPRMRRGRHRMDGSGQLWLTQMRVQRVLKGANPGAAFYFVTGSNIPELNPRCCVAGRSYILLLKQGSDDNFYAVNGEYSAIAIP